MNSTESSSTLDLASNLKGMWVVLGEGEGALTYVARLIVL